MMSDFYNSSRRKFLKQAGLLASLPILGSAKGFSAEKTDKNLSVRVLTCNIRVDLPEDSAKGLGWQHRREACLQVIKNQKADLIGFQEVLKNQFLDLKRELSDYFAFGFDGPEMDRFKEGYHGIAKNPILFSKKRFELITAGGYWLSETPLIAGSISWGSARARNCSWVRLLDKKTKREIRLINLHLDHVSNEAKLGQIKLVLAESAQYEADFPQIMTGDFNNGYAAGLYPEIIDAGWKDTYVLSNGDAKPEGTTNAFRPDDSERNARAKKIDFIFVKGPLTANKSHIIKDLWKGVVPSDHWFLSADVLYT
ncbi:endonuclease/exonuclease/phosphatase family protein [Sphingobacteruim zhuxiongii]|nr:MULTISPECIES: endonuclease/exonuclease/phosphatase family protein [unclassified Sphingobacterium]